MCQQRTRSRYRPRECPQVRLIEQIRLNRAWRAYLAREQAWLEAAQRERDRQPRSEQPRKWTGEPDQWGT